MKKERLKIELDLTDDCETHKRTITVALLYDGVIIDSDSVAIDRITCTPVTDDHFV